MKKRARLTWCVYFKGLLDVIHGQMLCPRIALHTVSNHIENFQLQPLNQSRQRLILPLSTAYFLQVTRFSIISLTFQIIFNQRMSIRMWDGGLFVLQLRHNVVKKERKKIFSNGAPLNLPDFLNTPTSIVGSTESDIGYFLSRSRNS